MAKRLLVIEKLVVAIPDDFAGTDHPDRPELTINDALRFLLDYRESQNAVIENRFGNFEYTSMDFPADTMPEGKALRILQRRHCSNISQSIRRRTWQELCIASSMILNWQVIVTAIEDLSSWNLSSAKII